MRGCTVQRLRSEHHVICARQPQTLQQRRQTRPSRPQSSARAAGRLGPWEGCRLAATLRAVTASSTARL